MENTRMPSKRALAVLDEPPSTPVRAIPHD
jgi:hypothetical protein